MNSLFKNSIAFLKSSNIFKVINRIYLITSKSSITLKTFEVYFKRYFYTFLR